MNLNSGTPAPNPTDAAKSTGASLGLRVSSDMTTYVHVEWDGQRLVFNPEEWRIWRTRLEKLLSVYIPLQL